MGRKVETMKKTIKLLMALSLAAMAAGCLEIDTSGVEERADKALSYVERLARGQLSKEEVRQLCRACRDTEGEIDTTAGEGCDYPRLEELCRKVEQPTQVSF